MPGYTAIAQTLLLALLLAACGQTPGAAPTATTTPAPAEPTATPAEPTATATEALEPSPTLIETTPSLPATVAPMPSATAQPTTAPSPTKAQTTPTQPESAVFDTVTIYLVAEGQGDVGCGDALVPVERQVEPTRAPLTAAVRELISLDQRTLSQAGLYNVFFRSRLQVESVELNNAGHASIRLSGDFTIGGVCDSPRVEATLTRTALQFDTVKSVEVFINNTPLDELLSGR